MKRMRWILAIVLLVTGSISCNKITDFNVDPNNPSIDRATPQLLFPSATMSTAGQINGEYAYLGGLWAQYYTQSATASQYRTVDAYNMIPDDFRTAYQEIFRSGLSDYKKVQDLSLSTGQYKFYLMATVMKAYTYQMLVDLYDQIPYSEALQGSSNLQPKFDAGYDVYKGLLAEIDSAVSLDWQTGELNESDAKADLVFNGDMDNWQRFANTLKLKMYLRMVNAKPDEAVQGVKSLYDAGALFLETGAGITTFQDKPNYSNPFYEQNIRRLNTNDNLRASVTFVSWLEANEDPRIEAYFGTTTPSAINQGDYSSTNPSYPGAAIFVQNATDPAWFISKAESYFLQAEARLRYYNDDGAEELYNQGVTAAFEQVDMSPADLLTTKYKYPNTTFDQKLEAIIVQKWASFPGTHDLEGFFEQNRTGYPKISPVYSDDPEYVPGQLVYSKNGITGGLFPKRLLFPDLERARNINTPAEVPITTKVWWAL
jgi:hypothetical protein